MLTQCLTLIKLILAPLSKTHSLLSVWSRINNPVAFIIKIKRKRKRREKGLGSFLNDFSISKLRRTSWIAMARCCIEIVSSMQRIIKTGRTSTISTATSTTTRSTITIVAWACLATLSARTINACTSRVISNHSRVILAHKSQKNQSNQSKAAK